jgi:hypothetical protein
MPDYKIGTREEWQAARAELAKLEAEHAQVGQKVTERVWSSITPAPVPRRS